MRQDMLKGMSFPADLIVFGLATVLLAILFEKISLKPQAKARPIRQAAGEAETRGANSNASVGHRRAF